MDEYFEEIKKLEKQWHTAKANIELAEMNQRDLARRLENLNFVIVKNQVRINRLRELCDDVEKQLNNKEN